MKKAIVTTTIHRPTKAIIKFIKICKRHNWKFFIVGDLKTPHDLYLALEKKYPKIVCYISPKVQEKRYKELSDGIGWNCIMRRNLGFVEAYNWGAKIIATVDDDNIPYDFWGENLYVNKEVEVDLYEPEAMVFDPLSITKANFLWHRGFPIDLLQERLKVEYKGKTKRRVLVQADLWDGDPDIDAIARLTFKPMVNYDDISQAYCSNKISPFNSQNTFLSRKVFPEYFLFPGIGRMDDIWGGYILQYYFPESVIYNKASVYQDRNKQDLVTNLEKEIIGYRKTLEFINNLKNPEKILPKEIMNTYAIYKKQFKQ